MRRVVQRDITERGKVKKQAKNDFLKSWDIYYKKMKNISSKNNIKEIIVTNENNIDQILKKIFN